DLTEPQRCRSRLRTIPGKSQYRAFFMEIISSSDNLFLIVPGRSGRSGRKLVEQEELLLGVRPERPKLLTTFTNSRSKHEKVPTLVDRGVDCCGRHSRYVKRSACGRPTGVGVRE